MIVERPGRTSVAVRRRSRASITHIAAVEGEAVTPGQELFKIRLTHEEIVQAQGEFLEDGGRTGCDQIAKSNGSRQSSPRGRSPDEIAGTQVRTGKTAGHAAGPARGPAALTDSQKSKSPRSSATASCCRA